MRKPYLLSIFILGFVIQICNAQLYKDPVLGIPFETTFAHSSSLSADGQIIAVGSLGKHPDADYAGYVSVYEFDGYTWQQMGEAIVSEWSLDLWGAKVSLSADGLTLAIGAGYHRPIGSHSTTGAVKVYQWNGNDWSLKGSPFWVDESQSRFGNEVKLSGDGNLLAVAAKDKNLGSSHSSHGMVQVYEWKNNEWIQLGQDIYGQHRVEHFGRCLEFSSDGSTLAVTGNLFIGDDNYLYGLVRTYRWNGMEWQQMGPELRGEEPDSEFGSSISLSADGNVLAVGGAQHDGAGEQRGHFKIFEFKNNNWVPEYQQIGEVDKSLLGQSVDLSDDGKRVVFGFTLGSFDVFKIQVHEKRDGIWSQLGESVEPDRGRWTTTVKISPNGNIVTAHVFNIIEVYSFDGYCYRPEIRFRENENDNCEPIFPDKKIGFSISSPKNTFEEFIYYPSPDNCIVLPFSDSIVVEPLIDTFFLEVEGNKKRIYTPENIQDFFQDGQIRDIFCLNKRRFLDVGADLVPLEFARPGFEVTYLLKYENLGTVDTSGIVQLEYPEELEFISADPNFSQQDQGMLEWEFNELKTFESRDIHLTFRVNSPMDTPAVNLGSRICLNATIYPLSNDQRINNNETELCQTAINSFDPNDKRCLDGEKILPEQVGEEIQYMIRFENTGNAYAVIVRIEDVIDTSVFKIESFRIIDASHDPVEVKISQGNLVEFIFNGIYLPSDDENNDGHVVFGIETKDYLSIGDQVVNKASIFFDFNFPIVTDPFTTEIVDESVSTFTESKLIEPIIYPNPSHGFIQVYSPQTIESVAIFNTSGKLVYSKEVRNPNSHKLQIRLNHLPPGPYTMGIASESGLFRKLFILQ